MSKQTQTRHKKIDQYINLLKTYNEHTNVYSKHAYDKLDFHIKDCETLAFHLKKDGDIFDFGSGSGLPSAILAILKPNSTIHAIDSTLKKTKFLFHVKQELNLTNFNVHHMDVLSFVRATKDRPTYVTAKAFASFDKIKSFTDKIKPSSKGFEIWVPISRQQKAEILSPENKKPYTSHLNFIESNSYLYLTYLKRY